MFLSPRLRYNFLYITVQQERVFDGQVIVDWVIARYADRFDIALCTEASIYSWQGWTFLSLGLSVKYEYKINFSYYSQKIIFNYDYFIINSTLETVKLTFLTQIIIKIFIWLLNHCEKASHIEISKRKQTKY